MYQRLQRWAIHRKKPGRQWEVQNDLSETERSCCKNWNLLSWELRVSLRPRSRLFHIHILHDELSELVRTLMRCFLIADEAGENRQVAAFSRCLQSQRTSCLIRMLFIESTWAALRKIIPEQKKGLIMEMIKLCQTATKYLFSIHCYKRLKEGIHVIIWIVKKMAQIISQEEDQPTDRWVDTLSGLSDPRELVPRNGSDKYLRVLKLPLSTTILHKLQKAFLCCALDNAFPRALNKQKLLTKNVLLSDESNNERCSKRVTGHGQAHAMPITRSLMQTCRVACSV